MIDALILGACFLLWTITNDIMHGYRLKRLTISHERSNWLKDKELSLAKAKFDWEKVRSAEQRVIDASGKMGDVKKAGLATWFEDKSEKPDAKIKSTISEAKQNLIDGEL